MPSNAILHEVQQLCGVSDRLDSLVSVVPQNHVSLLITHLSTDSINTPPERSGKGDAVPLSQAPSTAKS
jgi:hypothetical protein